MYPMFKESKLINLYQKSGPEPNERDEMIALARLKQFDQDPTPRMGDYVIMPDGTYERFSHDWYDTLQTCYYGSFYLGNGYASMSGSLNPGIPYENIEITSEQKPGDFWFFHNDYQCADNGIGVRALCRVYRVIPALTITKETWKETYLSKLRESRETGKPLSEITRSDPEWMESHRIDLTFQDHYELWLQENNQTKEAWNYERWINEWCFKEVR